MSVALEDIWNTPAQRPSRDHATSPVPMSVRVDDELSRPSPAKRPRTTLFLSDSEDGCPRKPTPTHPSRLNPDIESLFDDLESEPELAPSLDLNELRRQAAARHVAKVPTLTPREILPSSSPPRGLEGDDGDGFKKKGKDEEKPKRTPLPKLNEARLLGPDGFPSLVKQTKSFKPRGKGHEVTDLDRLMQIYQFWTHKMYPKNQFRENVQRVEKLCHSKRMMVAMTVWRDESKGIIHGRKPTENDLDLNPDGVNIPSAPTLDPSASPPSSPIAQRSDAASPPSRPPSSASEHNTTYSDDDIDIDALIREDAERQATAPALEPSPTLNADASNYRKRTLTDAMDEDDEGLWSSFDDPSLFDDPSTVPASTSAATTIASGPEDDEEELWEIMREQEEEEDRSRQPTVARLHEPSPTSVLGRTQTNESQDLGEGQRPTSDEGWDEMYM